MIVDGRKCDNLLRHPADSPHWKKIDEIFPEFGVEPRNLRLGLASRWYEFLWELK